MQGVIEPDYSASDDNGIGVDTGGIYLCLFSTRVHYADRRELVDLLLHRYLLPHYLAVSLMALFLMYITRLTSSSVGDIYPAIIVTLFAVLVVLRLYLAIGSWIAERARANRDRPAVLRFEPGVVLAAIAMIATFRLVESLTLMEQNWTDSQRLLVDIVAPFVLFLIVQYMMSKVVPRALRRMREDRAAVDEEADGYAEDEAPEAAPDGSVSTSGDRQDDEAAGAEVAVDGATLAVLSGILRLEASGNYVTIVTEKGRHVVPGPFSAAVARMPSVIGLQVHRSHWVARRAVIARRRVGRDLFLQTIDGAMVPVAASRASCVRDWLGRQDLAAPPERAVAARS